MLQKVLAFFKSLRLTVALILALMALILLGIAVPQKALLGREGYLAWQESQPDLVAFLEALKLTELHSSPLMILLWLLFFTNLALVMIDRIPGIYRLSRELRLPRDAGFSRSYRHSQELPGVPLARLAQVLENRKYQVLHDGVALAGVRNRYAPLATLVFHFSFLLLLAGGVLTLYTKFRAEADVAVGERFDGHYSQVHTRPKIGSVPDSRFTVVSVKPQYFNHSLPTDLTVELETPQGLRSISINHPFYDGALSFLVKNIDVAPLFLILNAAGEEVDGAFIKLKVLNGEEDGFTLQGYRFLARFHTNSSAGEQPLVGRTANLPQSLNQQPEEKSPGQGREIIHPAMTLTPMYGDIKLAPVTLRPGESLLLDNGWRLVWQDYTYWVNFYVGYERGLSIVYAAFAIMTLALILRFGFYRREIRAFADGDRIVVAGRSEYFPVMFSEEFSQLIASSARKDSD